MSDNDRNPVADSRPGEPVRKGLRERLNQVDVSLGRVDAQHGHSFRRDSEARLPAG